MRVATSEAIAGLGVALGALLILYGFSLGEAGGLWKAAGLGLGGLTLFATRAIPEIATAFLIFLSAIALGAIPRDAVFAGFATGGFWLLVSGIILGAAISSTGLAARISENLLALSGPSYARATLVIAGAGLLLGVLIPSTMPRIVVMIPVAAALAERLGLAKTGQGAIGLVATATAATLLPTYAILTANLPTIVQIGAMEKLHGVQSTYSAYLLQQWPVNFLRFGVLVLLMMRFTSEPVADRPADEGGASPDRPEQRRLLLVLGIAILAWMTDFAHGIEPAWVAMAAAAIVIWPKFGMLGPNAMREQIDLSPPIFFAALVTIVAVARGSGLDQILADAIIGSLPLDPNGGLASAYSVYGFSLILSHFTTAPAAPAILAPFAPPLADATGLSLEAISMIQIMGISTPLIPYQAPPLIVAMSISKIPNAVYIRLCLWLGLAVALIGVPLTYGWWRIIGFV